MKAKAVKIADGVYFNTDLQISTVRIQNLGTLTGYPEVCPAAENSGNRDAIPELKKRELNESTKH